MKGLVGCKAGLNTVCFVVYELGRMWKKIVAI
jgi:hypothetical protein